jgi:hypothetical protein
MRRLGWVLPLVSPVALGACGHDEVTVPRAPSSTLRADVTAPSSAPSTIVWRAGPPFPSARDHHATFIVETPAGAFLYTVGGGGMHDFRDDGWRARISDGGTLGAWEPIARLPAPLAGSGLVVDGRKVVLAAGRVAKAMRSDVVLGAVADDGSIAWRDGPPLPAARFHLTCSSWHGFVFAVGGLGPDFSATSAIHVATLRPDGSLDAWTTARALPAPRSHHAAVVHDGTLYLIGGLRGDPRDDEHVQMLDDVIAAKISENGSLGEWRTMSPLDARIATHSAIVEDGYVWIFGGIGAEASDRILRAPFAADGALGAWAPVKDPLPRKRAHVHQTPFFHGYVYSVGGNVGEHVPMADVAIGVLSARGPR